MMTNDEKLATLLRHGLKHEFEEETYGKTMFFPDDVTVREAKFMIWLFDRYGVKEQAMEEANKYLTLYALRKK